MVAAAALPHRRAAEFAAPEHQGVVEQAALLEVDDQRRARPVGLLGRDGHVLLDVAMMVPGAVVELDEAHPALGHAPGEQAVAGEAAIALLLDAVAREGRRRLPAQVGEAGHRGLHAVGHLVLAVPGGDLGIVDARVGELVEAGDLIDQPGAGRRHRPRRGWRRSAPHRPWTGTGCPGSGWAGSPLDHCRAETGWAPPPRPCEVSTTKPGRSSGLGAQAVDQPRTPARPALDRRAGVHEGLGGIVVDLLGAQRADDAELVGDRCRGAGRGWRSPARLAPALEVHERAARLELVF